MRSRQIIELILTDNDQERAFLEKALDIRQERMVDHYIDMCAKAGMPLWPIDRTGTSDERRKAVQDFLRKTEKFPSS